MPKQLPTFRPPHAQARSEQKREQDERRGSARARGYTRVWDREAKAYLADHPLCVGCLALGRYVAAVLVDHIEPHKGDEVLFWRRDNWQSSCDWHHRVVKAILEQRWQAGRLTVDQLRLDSAQAMALTEGGQNLGSRGAGPPGEVRS